MVIRILAWDYSGSTRGTTYYHSVGKKYVEQFRAKSSKNVALKHLLWDDMCVEVESTHLDRVIREKDGNNGTYPSTIVNWIKKHLEAEDEVELWLITDGEIDTNELKKCAKLNETMSYALVKFIIINENQINMSVGASFMSESAVDIYVNENKYKTIKTSAPFDYDSITIDNFEERWADLSDYIQAKFMGSDRHALQESDKLGSLRKRLLEELAKAEACKANATVRVAKFQSKKKADLIRDFKECEFYKNLTNTDLKDARGRIDGMISTLVNYIHNDNKSFNFNNLKVEFKTERIAVAEEEPEIENLEDTEECKFFDAVSFSEELSTPVLLLNYDDLILRYWVNGSYSKFRAIIDCPFFSSIESCVGHVFSLETFKSLRAHAENSEQRLINPMTNEEVFGGLVLSNSTEADQWNDYVIAHTFFRGKKVCSNFSLWYYVIWKQVQNSKWIELDVEKKLREYAYRRIKNSKVRLAFSSLPLDPQERVSVPVACFYCTEGSSKLFGESVTLFAHERLRMFSGVAHYMLEILDHFGYEDVNKKFVEARAKALSIVSKLKRIPQNFEKRYILAEKVFKKSEDGRFLTHVVKDKESLKYFNLLKYGHKEMIPFDYGADPIDVKNNLLFAYKFAETNVELCSETYRPYFVVYEKSGKKVPNYRHILNAVKEVELDGNGEVKYVGKVKFLNQFKLLSPNKIYINLVYGLQRFPTIDEFKDEVANVKKFKEHRLVFLFPENTEECLENVFSTYEKLGVTDVNFMRKSRATVSIHNRVMLEKRLEEKQIDKFVGTAKELLKNV